MPIEKKGLNNVITLEVNDFGPVAQAKVQLKPLTVFVGPNNSGKSYLAVLAYAIFRSLPPLYRITRFFRWPSKTRSRGQLSLPSLELFEAELMANKEVIESLGDWFKNIPEKGGQGERNEILLGELPETVREVFNKAFKSSMEDSVAAFAEELQRCYASEISDLTRKSAQRQFKISIAQDSPPLHLNVSCNDNKLKLDESQFDMSNHPVRLIAPFRRLQNKTLRHSDNESMRFILSELLEGLLVTAYREFQVDPYYFPAARSGILQSHKALASYVVSRSPLAGIEKFPEIPRLQGVVVDFISSILNLQKDRESKLHEVATFLEKNVTKGTVDIEATKLEYPEIYYGPDSQKFPLHRTSSMVSELAPLVLFLKYLIDPGDFLIIEEPESHLHPASQRKLARVIVKLVRNSVKVLITTHSDYFVEQLSNFIKLSQVGEEQRVKQGYSAQDYLAADEVGAYLFQTHPKKRGSTVSSLQITPEEGIPSDEFLRVVEELHEETVQLDRMITR